MGHDKVKFRNNMRKKLFKNKKQEKSWRQKHEGSKDRKEARLIKLYERNRRIKAGLSPYDEEVNTSADMEGVEGAVVNKNYAKPYSISIAIPGAFLNNAQSAELRSYMAGQIARAATLFRVSEIIVYDETARMTEEQVSAYWCGSWHGDIQPTSSNLESNFVLARILEYLECPQYLRKALFQFQKPLQYAGLLNPLDSQHHVKGDDTSAKFRDGVILDKPVKKGRGPLVDVGLDKELQLEEECTLPVGTRITVELVNQENSGKRYRGRLSSAKKAEKKCGSYWGYTVSIAKRIGEVLNREKFDYIIGTSPKGTRAKDFDVPSLDNVRVLIVFGGISGVEAAIEGDEAYEGVGADDSFDLLLRPFISNGSRSERIEENVLVGLSVIDSRLADLFGFQAAA